MGNLSTTVPLVGRASEMARVKAALADGAPAGCVLVGGGGVGKSHLARHCLLAAEAAGDRTARVLATRSAASIPLGALATVVPECGDGPAAMQAARQALHDLAGRGRLVLLVDDAHLLDEASAAVILSVAADPVVWCLLTVRSGEPCPDAVTAVWKDLGAERIEVHPLDASGVAAVVDQMLGGRVPPPVVDRLARLSGGRPLALRELVRAATDAGHLRLVDGSWELTGDPGVPPSMAELIGDRLQRMGPAARDLVAMLALCEPMPVAAIERAGLGEALELLEDSAVVAVTDPGGSPVTGWILAERAARPGLAARLDHPLYGEVVLGGLSERRRQKLLVEAAAALSDVAADDRDLMRTVLWRHWSGESLDADQLLDAARRCYRNGEYRRCGELAQAAWQTAPSFDAGHLLGFALGREGRCDEAETVLAATDDLAADDREVVLVTLARAENRFRGLHDPAGSEALCTVAEARIAEERWRAEVRAHRAMGVVQAGDVDRALELLEPMLDPDVYGERAFVKAAYAAGIALCHAGRADDATAVALRALPVHQALWSDDLFQTEPGVHHLTTLFAMVAAGRLADARTLLEVARELTRGAVPPYGHAWICFISGLAALRHGLCDEAVEHFDVAVPLFVEGRHAAVASWCEAGAATAEALKGNADRAGHRLDSAAALSVDGVGLNSALAAEARGWTAVARGADGEAAETFASGAARALERGDRLGAAHLLVGLARCGGAPEALALIAPLAGRVQGDLIDVQVALVEVLARPAATGEALALAQDLAERGMLLESAELAATAARHLRRAGHGRAAARAAAFGREVLGRCQGARAPLVADLHSSGQLTGRELDIARLAATRLSSKEIAGRLAISARTVDNHLRNVYRKLGVAGRADLGAALGESRDADRP